MVKYTRGLGNSCHNRYGLSIVQDNGDKEISTDESRVQDKDEGNHVGK